MTSAGAGIPVVTAHGRHFAFRVTESLLNALNLPELVGHDRGEIVRIAVHVGQDAEYRKRLREQIRQAIESGLKTSKRLAQQRFEADSW
jgi:protein O-GlcNAc transferase